MDKSKLKNIIEAVLLAANRPMSVSNIEKLFDDNDRPNRDDIREALARLTEECAERGYELKRIASGYRYQVKQDMEPWVSRLWEERPPRYSRALLETLALIAYRQPITRAEIEDIRGVGVSSSIMKTLLEREWVRIVGHRDVPGKPAMYGSTRQLLDYFNLKSLDELPTLAEIKDLDKAHPELDLGEPRDEASVAEDHAETAEQAAADGMQVSVDAVAEELAKDDTVVTLPHSDTQH